jgi:hypothetical protein
MPRHHKPSFWRRLLSASRRHTPQPVINRPTDSERERAQAHPANLQPVQAPHDMGQTASAHPLPIYHSDALAQPDRASVANTLRKLLVLETPNRSFVLGLKWQAIVIDQRKDPNAAWKIARNARASFYAPGIKGVVGHGVPDAQARERLRKLSGKTRLKSERSTMPVCAGLLAASQVQEGVFALSLPTDEPAGLVWMLWVQGGRPVGTERLVSVEQAQQALNAEESHPDWSMSTILTARRQLSWPVEAGNECGWLLG